MSNNMLVIFNFKYFIYIFYIQLLLLYFHILHNLLIDHTINRISYNEVYRGRKAMKTDRVKEPYYLRPVHNIYDLGIDLKDLTDPFWLDSTYKKSMDPQFFIIDANEEMTLTAHPDYDQFIRIEKGKGVLLMEQLNFQHWVTQDDAFIIPAGTSCKLTNTKNEPMKFYSIQAFILYPTHNVHTDA
jgi:mannose-6-phosphate isomerase-like protein (cupin superfamily)